MMMPFPYKYCIYTFLSIYRLKNHIKDVSISSCFNKEFSFFQSIQNVVFLIWYLSQHLWRWLILSLHWHVTLVSPNVELSLHFKFCYIILLVCCQNLSADILFRIFVLLFISEIYYVFFLLYYFYQVLVSKFS